MQTAAAVDQNRFRKTCGKFATGVAVATVSGRDGTPNGLTVNSFTSVSCDPPLVLVCIDYRSAALDDFRSASVYGINILSDTQRDISIRFAQKQCDRFDGIQWYRGDSGVPLLEGAVASLECAVTRVVEAGDHAIFLAEVVGAEYRDGEPLLYWGGSYRTLAPR